jgi:HD-GYP domain-containing protein (c-di-GMP phosphodiesterase class II)
MLNSDIFSERLINLLQKSTVQSYDETINDTMEFAASIADADVALLFQVSSDNFLNLTYGHINSLSASVLTSSNLQFFPPVSLRSPKGNNLYRPEESCAINHEIINTSNLFGELNLDTSFLREFDRQNDYTTVSALIFPVFNSSQNLIAVAQFMNARNISGRIINFSLEEQEKIIAVCQIIAATLDKKMLKESYTQLLEGFIDVLAKAIDTKSPYTGQHCQKVPIITRLLASAAVSQTSGPFKNFEMSDDDWYALHIASWLHDCGKIITPEHLIDKAVKLETVYNRIHEIRTRFEVLRRDAHIEYLQKRLQNADTKENLQAEFVERVKQLTDDFEFIAQCNAGDTALEQDDLDRIDKIAKHTYTRYFNRMSGLSRHERKLIKNPETYTQPEIEHILQDRSEQIGEIDNQGELVNIKILKGTINDNERHQINNHIVATINMLKSLPFPPNLSKIVDYAGAHHERVDGKGYPYGLKGDQIPIPAKIMAVADVYEALSAKDRPYKDPKKLSEILHIMQKMKNSGHLDPDVYELFIQSGVYMDYAKEYLDKDQIDEINPVEYL